MKKINLKELGAEVDRKFKYAALDEGGYIYVYEKEPYYSSETGRWIVCGDWEFINLEGVEDSKLNNYSPEDSLFEIDHGGDMKKINPKSLEMGEIDVFSYIARDYDGDIYVYQCLPKYRELERKWFPTSGMYNRINREDATKIEPLLSRGEVAVLEKGGDTEGDEKDSLYFLNKATETQSSRAGEYDTVGEKERNMQKIVDMFNACTGKSLTEAEGYLFMECLKNVRLFNAPDFHEDSAVDGVSYSSLKAEAKAKEYS